VANQTLQSISPITTPVSAALLWVNDATASPQDRSWSLTAAMEWLNKKPKVLTSGDTPYTWVTPFKSPALITTGASNFVFNLPAATGTGLRIDITKVDSGAGAVQIAPNGTDVIDKAGNVSVYLGLRYQSVTLIDSTSGVWLLQPQGKRSFVSTSGTLGTLVGSLDALYVLTAASTVTLPANPFPGQQLTFKAKTTATSTISANSGQTIGTTSSTSFILYAQEDYVTLEWDGTSIWYVVATNGPVISSDQTATKTTSVSGSWAAIGNGLVLSSLGPGVYDFTLDVTLTSLGNHTSIGIGDGTTLISTGNYNIDAQASVSWKVTASRYGYVINVATNIQGIYKALSTGDQIIYYAALNSIGKLAARRIG
jgi:hypothetical protein